MLFAVPIGNQNWTLISILMKRELVDELFVAAGGDMKLFKQTLEEAGELTSVKELIKRGRNLILAAALAAAAPAAASAMSPHPSCDMMLAVLADARDTAIHLDNTRFPQVNWVLNTFSPGSSKRAQYLAALEGF